MKKLLAILLTVALMVPCFSMTAFAESDGHKVSGLHFTIDMSSVEPGSAPDDFDLHNIPVTWDATDTSTYPGLKVNVTDLTCQNTNHYFKIGDTAKFKFWIEISGKDSDGKDYYMASGTNAHVATKSGTTPKVKSVSKHRQNDLEMYITVTSAPLSGQYDEPEDLEWKSGTSLGQAKWKDPESGNSTGYYNIRLKRNDKTVYSYDAWNSTSFNFYPWMTKEGDYEFEVMSVPSPNGSNGGKKSDWATSDDQYVDEKHVSDGTGQIDPSNGSTNGGGSKVGWQKINNQWYFYYPDGSMRKNGWEKIASKWYYFDASGAMKTGWLSTGNQTYYLDPTDGDMRSGWVKTSDGQWYYLDANQTSATYGAMLKNQFVDANGKRYYMTNSGAMATGWVKIGNDYYHFNSDGSMSVSTRVDGFLVDAAGRWVKGE